MAQRHDEAAELGRLTEQADSWRATRAKLAPMPEPLWPGAVGLARRLGVNPVKEALGLNYNALLGAVRHRWFAPLFAWVRLPGIRFVAEQFYALVSRWRFRIAGTTCDGGCSIYR